MLNNSLTLGEYLEKWLSFYCSSRLAPNTIRGYRVNIYNHIIPHIGDVKLCNLSPDMIDDLYYQLRCEGLSPTTILYVHAVLRKALNTAMKRRMVTENVIDFVDPPRKQKYKPKFINGELMSKLLEYSKNTELYIPLLLALSFGLRRGEILGLFWRDINFDMGTITINQTATFVNNGVEYTSPKTDSSGRVLLMPDSLKVELMRWKIRQPRSVFLDVVCTTLDGRLLTSNRFQTLFKRALKACDLPDMRIHDLRHSYATLMLENNISPKIVCDILGHSSVDVTLDIYSHVLTTMQKPAVNAIETVLKSSQLDFNKKKNA